MIIIIIAKIAMGNVPRRVLAELANVGGQRGKGTFL